MPAPQPGRTSAPRVLVFDGTARDGRFGVRRPDGRLVAETTVRLVRGTFTTALPGGGTLCSGGRRALGLTRSLRAVDDGGTRLVAAGPGGWSGHLTRFPDGRRFTVPGELAQAGWEMADPAGTRVLTCRAGGRSPDEWSVERGTVPLTLAEFVATVELCRMVARQRRRPG